jgi:hypothetical protein
LLAGVVSFAFSRFAFSRSIVSRVCRKGTKCSGSPYPPRSAPHAPGGPRAASPSRKPTGRRRAPADVSCPHPYAAAARTRESAPHPAAPPPRPARRAPHGPHRAALIPATPGSAPPPPGSDSQPAPPPSRPWPSHRILVSHQTNERVAVPGVRRADLARWLHHPGSHTARYVISSLRMRGAGVASSSTDHRGLRRRRSRDHEGYGVTADRQAALNSLYAPAVASRPRALLGGDPRYRHGRGPLGPRVVDSR